MVYRWAELNVVENIKKMMLEYVSVYGERLQTTHLAISAAYKSGVTLFAVDGSIGAQRLKGTTL